MRNCDDNDCCKAIRNLETFCYKLEFYVSRCKRKLKLMSPRNKKIVALASSVLVFMYFYLQPMSWLHPEPVKASESLLETSKCPACYGSRMCGHFYYGQIKMYGLSKFRSLDYYNMKNVHFAELQHSGVVVKKLATNDELIEVDNKICHDAGELEGCDVSHIFPDTKTVKPFSTKALTLDVLKDTKSFVFHCPSYRLLDKMWRHFKEYEKWDGIAKSDKLKVLYISTVNPEPLILQTFRKSEGWPFPEYYGACGRTVVVENCGEHLGTFYHSDFSVRVALAYELMLVAETLTSKFDYAMYLTDLQFENFAVDVYGKISIVDLEHVLVVDKLDVKARAPNGWNIPHHSKFHDCVDDGSCLIFTSEDLCNHELSDHNYYVVCRLVLSQYSNHPDYPRGFLHSIPKEVAETWDLEYLLNTCANPRSTADRFTTKDSLMKALKGLNEEFKKKENLFHDLV